MKDLRADSRRYHVEYGKWLIASVLAVHLGAIFLLSNLIGRPAVDAAALIEAIKWHVGGVAFIIASGFCAWLNFQFAELIFDRWSDPAMLVDAEVWPGADENDTKVDPITATLYLAAAAGVFSLWCFIAGAQEGMSAIPLNP